MIRRLPQLAIASAIFLVFYLVLGASSRALATGVCSSLFLESPATAPFFSASAHRIAPTLHEFRMQMDARVGYDKIELTLTSAIQDTLSFMRDRLVTFEASVRREGLEQKIREANRRGKIGYLDYIQIADQFTLLATADMVKRDPAQHADPVMLQALERNLNAEPQALTNRIVEARSEWLFLPIITELGVPTMNELQAMGVAVLGVTAKVSYADALKFLPNGYFRHDFDHAFSYERQPFRNAGLVGWAAGGPRYPELRKAQRLPFYRRSREEMKTQGITARASMIRENLWFLAFHEAGYPTHPANLLRHMEQFQSRLDSIFGRFAEKADLGYAFRDRPVTREEVMAEIESVIVFAKNSMVSF